MLKGICAVTLGNGVVNTVSRAVAYSLLSIKSARCSGKKSLSVLVSQDISLQYHVYLFAAVHYIYSSMPFPCLLVNLQPMIAKLCEHAHLFLFLILLFLQDWNTSGIWNRQRIGQHIKYIDC